MAVALMERSAEMTDELSHSCIEGVCPADCQARKSVLIQPGVEAKTASAED